MSKKEKNLFTISFCENYESLLIHQPYFTILVGFILYEGNRGINKNASDQSRFQIKMFPDRHTLK